MQLRLSTGTILSEKIRVILAVPMDSVGVGLGDGDGVMFWVGASSPPLAFRLGVQRNERCIGQELLV